MVVKWGFGFLHRKLHPTTTCVTGLYTPTTSLSIYPGSATLTTTTSCIETPTMIRWFSYTHNHDRQSSGFLPKTVCTATPTFLTNCSVVEWSSLLPSHKQHHIASWLDEYMKVHRPHPKESINYKPLRGSTMVHNDSHWLERIHEGSRCFNETKA